jgi:hypothetical protein
MVMIDACFAGVWVDKLRQEDHKIRDMRLVIQAAASATEKARDTICFLRAYEPFLL